MKWKPTAGHLDRVWPRLARILAKRHQPTRRGRPRDYDDRTYFEALLQYVWRGLPVRGTLKGNYPAGPVLHRRWKVWRDAGTLKDLTQAYVASLSKEALSEWRTLFDGYERGLHGHTRNQPMAWLMVNRFWYEAIVLPFGQRPNRGRPS